MGLVAVRESKRARSVAETILLERLPVDLSQNEFDATSAFDGEGQLGVLPVFTLGAEQLSVEALGDAWKVGWRYFWVHPAFNLGAIISIRPDERRHPQLARYQWGEKAAQYASRLDSLVAQFKGTPGRQRLRILRLASLQMEAFWITSQHTDRLIGLTPELDDQKFLDLAKVRYFSILGKKI